MIREFDIAGERVRNGVITGRVLTVLVASMVLAAVAMAVALSTA